MDFIHKPIMLKEIIENLSLKPNDIVIDATCGEGGHSIEIIKYLSDGLLICIDRNKEIIQRAKERLNNYSNVIFINDNFINLKNILLELNIKKVDKILADLGISMFHYKMNEILNYSIGLSYTDDKSLDMRLDDSIKITAKYIVNHFDEKKIADILYQYGEEYEAKKIAKYICKNRPINNAKELADIVLKTKRCNYTKRIHPATKVFQALRIYVNNELENLENFIPLAIECLNKTGRLLIISFHSLEDRIIKNIMKDFEKKGIGFCVNKKPLVPTEQEKKDNISSRSAKLRIFEKL